MSKSLICSTNPVLSVQTQSPGAYPSRTSSDITIGVFAATMLLAPLTTSTASIAISKSSMVLSPPLSLVSSLVSVNVGATSSFVISQLTSEPGLSVKDWPMAGPAAGSPVVNAFASVHAQVPSV